jgi:hypothetical protein
MSATLPPTHWVTSPIGSSMSATLPPTHWVTSPIGSSMSATLRAKSKWREQYSFPREPKAARSEPVILSEAKDQKTPSLPHSVFAN